MTKKNLSDYFSVEAREARRQARLDKTATISGSFRGAIASKYAGTDERITTQNAGVKAVAMARAILDNYRLPSVPKLTYSGLRNGRTAMNSSKLEDGVITVHACFRTYSNVVVDIDVPFEIREGRMMEPSVIVHNGAPRIIAQSTFDTIVEQNTAFDVLPVREMYAQPMDNQVAKEQYGNRVKAPRVDRGMFSVQAAKDALRAAMRGTAINAEWEKPWEKDEDTDAAEASDDSVEKEAQMAPQCDMCKIAGRPPAPAVAVIKPPEHDLYVCDRHASTVQMPVHPLEAYGQPTQSGQNYGDFKTAQQLPPPVPDQTRPVGKYDQWGHQITQPLPQLKNPSQYQNNDKSFGYSPRVSPSEDWTDELDPANELTEAPGADEEHTDTPAGQQILTPENGEIDLGTGFEQTKMRPAAGRAPKQPKHIEPPKLKAKPDTKRLCAKCNHAPCICKNKRKKKSDVETIYRPIEKSADMLMKVKAEVDSMRDSGLQEIDIKQSVFKKYGPEIAASIFNITSAVKKRPSQLLDGEWVTGFNKSTAQTFLFHSSNGKLWVSVMEQGQSLSELNPGDAEEIDPATADSMISNLAYSGGGII